jgi:hypothetical protein
MAHYQRMGSVPHKRHTQHRQPSSRGKQGGLYYEELMGEEGFSSDSSLLYHRNIPSTIADAREWASATSRPRRTTRSCRGTCSCTTSSTRPRCAGPTR